MPRTQTQTQMQTRHTWDIELVQVEGTPNASKANGNTTNNNDVVFQYKMLLAVWETRMSRASNFASAFNNAPCRQQLLTKMQSR
mmetsp:Transcript_26042/g.71422  ORF Transcript_26042/g.71422 Transcript_26042/m.71422 type:complete len:84 (-) Transcript_26042:61-312(-)